MGDSSSPLHYEAVGLHVYEDGLNIHGPYRARCCVADAIPCAQQIAEALNLWARIEGRAAAQKGTP
jgi:hypothetical protein